MSEKSKQSTSVWKVPALCVIAIVIVLAMLRLGVWQLDRAEQKRQIVSQLVSKAGQSPLEVGDLETPKDLRFRSVLINGSYLVDKTIFVDNQVINGQVGYQVYTPFISTESSRAFLVGRGWVSVGASREQLPSIETPTGELSINGRFNLAAPKPSLWKDSYSAVDGARWQYLPMAQVSQDLKVALFPLVVELAPDQADVGALLIKWPEINDQWVAKHQGYAFQWFAMAFAFSLACVVLLIRRSKNKF